MSIRRTALPIALLLAAATTSAAQAVRGFISDPGTAPVSGVVVILVDAQSREVARVFSNDRGEYRITAPGAGTYRLRTLRIGYQPQLSEPFALAAGDAVDRPLTLAAVPTGLDTMRAVGRSACRMSVNDSSATTWRVWEQVRTALTVTQLTRGNRGMAATTVSFNKTLDPIRRQVRSQEFDVRSDFVSQPWRAATPAELRKFGYIITDANGIDTYHAPSLEALLADEFLEDHCLRLVTTRDPAVIGVEFEPNRDRSAIPEIKGTVWVTRATSALRSLEYRYANASKDVEGFGGGEVEFAEMANGTWAISSWNIRMPVLGMRAQARPGDLPEVQGIRVVGGQLALVTVGDAQRRDTLWMRPPLTLAGTVADSSGTPLARGRLELAGTSIRATTDNAGRFTFDWILPGIYTLKVFAGTDSVPVMQAPFKFADTTAMVQVRVPRSAVIATSATVKAAEARGLATLSGTVVGDSTNRPVADAEIAFPELGLTGRSDAKGQFTIAGIIPGAHVVVARRVGYGAMQTRLEFAARQVVDRRIVLTRLAVLDSVLTMAKPDNDPMLRAFEEHKRRGFGVFIDRTQLERHESQTLQTIVQQLSGLSYVRGRQGQLWVMNRRAPFTACPTQPPDLDCIRRERLLYVPVAGEATDGLKVACYSEVWMDRTLLNRGIPTMPFDVNTIAISQIQALEWYGGSTSVPPEYQTSTTSRCGVLILHTRRFKK